MSNLLEVNSVIKSFGGRQILTDICLQCKTGEVIGLLGRKGSGKSTVLKIIFGTLQSETKFIRIDGKIYDRTYKTKNEICYLPQDEFLPRNITAERAVQLFLTKKEGELFFDDSILNKIKRNKISELSGGELRYMGTKLLLNSDSKFVLLDEPFSGLSPILVDSVKNLILKKSNSKGIILTDHDYRNVLDVANRYCLMFDGGIKSIGNRNELIRWGYIPK